MKIGIVSCSKKKLPNSYAPARDIYCSPLAQKSLEHAEKTCDAVFFISGKHGLIGPDEWISSYDDNSSIQLRYYGGSRKVQFMEILKGGIGHRLQQLTEWLRE